MNDSTKPMWSAGLTPKAGLTREQILADAESRIRTDAIKAGWCRGTGLRSAPTQAELDAALAARAVIDRIVTGI